MANEYLSAAQLTKMGTDIGYAIKGLGSGSSVSVTYSRVTASAYVPTTGAVTDTKTDTTITVYRYEFVGKDSEGLERAMVGWMIAVADLSNEPSRKDRITESSIIYDVESWSLDPLRKFWVILTPKAAT
jgi:hypothetical protein